MKGVALGALVFMAVLFVIAFAFQEQYPPLAYVRAFAEGGMVGALADWFAVTALFRHPLGIPIPHTAIIPNRKDEIGRTLGEFVETEFLRGDVVRTKLEETAIAARLGEWLSVPEHAERVGAEGSLMAAGILRALSDDDVQRRHRRPRPRAPDRTRVGPAARRLARPHRGVRRPPRRRRPRRRQHRAWLAANRASFSGLVSRRLPAWVPSIASRLVDDTVYNEAVKFVAAVQADPRHPARIAIDGYLDRLAENLQHDPATIGPARRRQERRVRQPARARTRRRGVEHREGRAAASPSPTRRAGCAAGSPRRSARSARACATDAALQRRVDGWVTDAAVFLVDRYRHDIASIITDTVERWDAAETTEKIELMVGRDLQYIRLNGTIVGALAGLLIFTIAHALLG